MKKIILMLTIIIILSYNVFAIGITPGRTSLALDEKPEHKIELRLINNEHKDMTVVLYSEGELKDNIIIEKPNIQMTQSQEEYYAYYKLVIDDKIKKPGIHRGRVIAREGNDNLQDEIISVDVSAAVATQVSLIVPYPDKYLEPEFYTIGEDIDKEIRLYVLAVNLGLKKIENAYATIIVTDTNGKTALRTETSRISLDTLEKKEMIASWHPPIKPGKYKVTIGVTYDEKTTTLEKNIQLGYAIIDLIGVSVKDFKLGGIAKFNIIIENRGSSELNELFANMKITNKDGTEIAEIKSPTTTLPESERQTLYTYWDTEGISKGEHKSDLSLKNNQESLLDKKLSINVKDSSIDISILGTGYVIKEGSGEDLGMKPWITIGAILLVVSNISIILYYRKKKYEKQKPQEKAKETSTPKQSSE